MGTLAKANYVNRLSWIDCLRQAQMGQEVFYETDQLERTGYPCSGPL